MSALKSWFGFGGRLDASKDERAELEEAYVAAQQRETELGERRRDIHSDLTAQQERKQAATQARVHAVNGEASAKTVEQHAASVAEKVRANAAIEAAEVEIDRLSQALAGFDEQFTSLNTETQNLRFQILELDLREQIRKFMASMDAAHVEFNELSARHAAIAHDFPERAPKPIQDWIRMSFVSDFPNFKHEVVKYNSEILDPSDPVRIAFERVRDLQQPPGATERII